MDTDIELRYLRYFVAVAEELHFGRAARRLNISQPPLSQQIRKLEEILGCPLLLRTSRTVSLTTAGAIFLPRAQRMLANLQRDVQEVRDIGLGGVGSLNVGFVGSGMLATLPDIFRTYREAYPRVSLRLHEAFTSLVVSGLLNGTLDAGFLRDSDPAEGLTIATIFSEPFVAVLPVTHPRAKQKNISSGSLRDEPFVYYPRSAGNRAYEKSLALCEEYGFRPQIVQEAPHWLSILGLIGAGLGVTIAPACVRRIAPPDVVCLPLRDAKIVSNLELAYVTGQLSPIVQRFAQIATRKASHTTNRQLHTAHSV
ncbi:MAG TPA: LysR substrate-binding domain-containing protein [Acidisarcina sp.]